MELLRVHDVSKTFGRGHTAVKALDGIHLHVEPGGIVLIMGPSGSGKTTLLTIAGGLLKPTSGEVMIDGVDITNKSERELPAVRLQSLGFVFQSFNLLAALTAEQNVAVPLMIAGHSFTESRAKAQELLKRLGLEKRMHALPSHLSGGEKQRVAIARALINNPKIILADEPTANLDSNIGHEVMQLLCRLRSVAKRVLTIEDGRLTGEKQGDHEQYCSMKHQ
ncbi:MAG: ABC transporter ATP-binding protein [Candidatus Kerfeldbacteria bacterium]|nr:ABC transporter ATP-binding protein [Candidatus Kerfeldbacteria bacterium]